MKDFWGPGGVWGASWGRLGGVLGRLGASKNAKLKLRSKKGVPEYQRKNYFEAKIGPCWGQVASKIDFLRVKKAIKNSNDFQ